jgi:ankyrin repeat protein
MSTQRFVACAPLMPTLVAFGILSVAAPSVAQPPPLIEAVKSGDRAAALSLARRKPAVRAAEADGTTALHWAARQDDIELADRLLRSGADASVKNRYGVTPLYLAALNGSAPMIERLLDAGAEADEVGVEGETALMTVARTGSVPAARVLLERGAAVDAREAWHGQTALMWASAQGHPEMIRELVRRGADVNARSNVEEWERQTTAEPREKWLPPGGMAPLLFAAREGCLACIPVLVELGADVDVTTPDGISAVVLALINGHYDTAGELIEAGTDPNLYDYTGRGALYAAVDFNTMPSSNRPAPKVLENRSSALDIARTLLEQGADPNARLERLPPYRAKLDRGNDTLFNAGTTPFLRAAKAGDVPAMQLLLEHGADPTLSPERNGINPLMAAAGLGTTEQDTAGRYKTEAASIEAIRLLLDRGLDVNATDRRGRTALHGAALQGYDEVIRFLAANGAELEGEDEQGHTPLDTALGLAGGFGFAGAEGVVREDTAAMLRELIGESADAH